MFWIRKLQTDTLEALVRIVGMLHQVNMARSGGIASHCAQLKRQGWLGIEKPPKNS